MESIIWSLCRSFRFMPGFCRYKQVIALKGFDISHPTIGFVQLQEIEFVSEDYIELFCAVMTDKMREVQ